MTNEKLPVPIWTLIFIIPLFSACQEVDEDTRRDEVVDTLKEIFEAFKNRDAEAFISHFSHDADLEGFVQGTPPEVGWEIVKESVKKVFRVATDIRAEIIDPQVDIYFDRTAVVTYLRKTKVTTENEAIERFVRGTVVMVKKDQDWKVVSYYYSDVVPQL